MKNRKIKYALALAFAAVALTGCTVWEDKWTECRPLPEVETPAEPDPWEPGGEEHEAGE